MLRPLLVLLLSLAAGAHEAAASPATWHLAAQVYSFHEHTDAQELHNTTPGVGIIRRQDDWLAGGGVFRNSLGRWAGYAYVGWQYPWHHARFGGIAGVTHHYDWNNGGIVPLAAAVVTVPVTRRLDLELVGIPRVHGATYATLNVSLSWQIR